VRRLSEAGVGVADLALRRPTLDDVFLSLTGHAAEALGESDDDESQDGHHGQGARGGQGDRAPEPERAA
jgi:ABC-2 type transport system ATP-binding protein